MQNKKNMSKPEANFIKKVYRGNTDPVQDREYYDKFWEGILNPKPIRQVIIDDDYMRKVRAEINKNEMERMGRAATAKKNETLIDKIKGFFS